MTGTGSWRKPMVVLSMSLLAAIWTTTLAVEMASASAPSLARATPAVDPDATFTAVACPAPASCFTVGHYATTSGGVSGVVETPNGLAWKAVEVNLPANSASPPAYYPNFITCSSKRSCLVLGTYRDTSGATQGLIETMTNGAWTDLEAPLPSGAAPSPAVAIAPDAACSAAGACVIVGTYDDSAGSTEGLIDTLTGSTWSSAEAPKPPRALNSGLTSVTCSTSTSCTAVGSFTTTTGYNAPSTGFLETLNRGTWTAKTLPRPAGTKEPVVSAIACPSTTECIGVGTLQQGTSTVRGLIETVSGTHWVPVQAAEPPSSGGNWELTGVSCPAVGDCVAVGNYYDTSGNAREYADVLAAGVWTASELPIPPNEIAEPSVYEPAPFAVVACSTATKCVAAGDFTDVGRVARVFLEVDTSGSWKESQAVLPDSYTGQLGYLEAIGCAVSSDCLAVGSYTQSAEEGVTQIEGFADYVKGLSSIAYQLPL